jgi:hypothetical protein
MLFRVVPGDSHSGKTNNFSYSNIFEYARVRIIIYSYFIVFIFWRIHIQRKPAKPYRIHAYLDIFKIKFSVSYFWPALSSGSCCMLRVSERCHQTVGYRWPAAFSLAQIGRGWRQRLRRQLELRSFAAATATADHTAILKTQTFTRAERVSRAASSKTGIVH